MSDFYVGQTVNGSNRILNQSALEIWQNRNNQNNKDVHTTHQMELNTSAAAKLMDQFVLVTGGHDLLAISGSRYIFAAARWRN